MSKRVRERVEEVIPELPGELWQEITKHFAYDDTATLLNMLAVSRNVIYILLPRIRRLLACFIRKVGKNEKKDEIVSLVEHHFALSGKTIHQFHCALNRYFKMNPNFWHATQLREYSASLLSMVRLAQLRNHYNKKTSYGREEKVDANFLPAMEEFMMRIFGVRARSDRLIERNVFSKPEPTTPLKNVFFKTTETSRGPLVPLINLEYVYVCVGMPASLDQLLVMTNEEIEKRPLHEREVYSLGIRGVKDSVKRAVSYYTLAEKVTVRRPNGEELFQDLLIEREEHPHNFRHIYTFDNEVVKQFKGHCVRYEGSSLELSRALNIESNWEESCLECGNRCAAIYSQVIHTVPLKDEDYSNLLRAEPMLDEVYVLKPETKEDFIYRMDATCLSK